MHLRWHICAETFRRIASNYVVPAVCIGVPRPPLKTGWSAARKKIVSAKKLPTGKKKREKDLTQTTPPERRHLIDANKLPPDCSKHPSDTFCAGGWPGVGKYLTF